MEQLERHEAMREHLFGEVDGGHPAAPELRPNDVAVDLLHHGDRTMAWLPCCGEDDLPPRVISG